MNRAAIGHDDEKDEKTSHKRHVIYLSLHLVYFTLILAQLFMNKRHQWDLIWSSLCMKSCTFDRKSQPESYVINFNQVDMYRPALGFSVFTLIRENLVQSHAWATLKRKLYVIHKFCHCERWQITGLKTNNDGYEKPFCQWNCYFFSHPRKCNEHIATSSNREEKKMLASFFSLGFAICHEWNELFIHNSVTCSCYQHHKF